MRLRSIAKSIKSVLNQSFREFEFVIVNDGSTDKTEAIINGFKDERIRYLKNNENLGISKSRNRSLLSSRGEYVFFNDANNVLTENWIEQGLKTLLNSGFPVYMPLSIFA